MESIIQWILILLIFLFLAQRFLPVKGVTSITAEDAKQKVKDKKAQFIDVRTPHEYDRYHDKTFTNIPLHTLSEQVDKLNKQTEVVLICQSGMRSIKAAKILKKHGFEKITNVKGGMNAWD